MSYWSQYTGVESSLVDVNMWSTLDSICRSRSVERRTESTNPEGTEAVHSAPGDAQEHTTESKEDSQLGLENTYAHTFNYFD
jgi:hypothetical protein